MIRSWSHFTVENWKNNSIYEQNSTDGDGSFEYKSKESTERIGCGKHEEQKQNMEDHDREKQNPKDDDCGSP